MRNCANRSRYVKGAGTDVGGGIKANAETGGAGVEAGAGAGAGGGTSDIFINLDFGI